MWFDLIWLDNIVIVKTCDLIWLDNIVIVKTNDLIGQYCHLLKVIFIGQYCHYLKTIIGQYIVIVKTIIKGIQDTVKSALVTTSIKQWLVSCDLGF
jgi:hypothetical protein